MRSGARSRDSSSTTSANDAGRDRRRETRPTRKISQKAGMLASLTDQAVWHGRSSTAIRRDRRWRRCRAIAASCSWSCSRAQSAAERDQRRSGQINRIEGARAWRLRRPQRSQRQNGGRERQRQCRQPRSSSRKPPPWPAPASRQRVRLRRSRQLVQQQQRPVTARRRRRHVLRRPTGLEQPAAEAGGYADARASTLLSRRTAPSSNGRSEPVAASATTQSAAAPRPPPKRSARPIITASDANAVNQVSPASASQPLTAGEQRQFGRAEMPEIIVGEPCRPAGSAEERIGRRHAEPRHLVDHRDLGVIEDRRRQHDAIGGNFRQYTRRHGKRKQNGADERDQRHARERPAPCRRRACPALPRPARRVMARRKPRSLRAATWARDKTAAVRSGCAPPSRTQAPTAAQPAAIPRAPLRACRCKNTEKAQRPHR